MTDSARRSPVVNNYLPTAPDLTEAKNKAINDDINDFQPHQLNKKKAVYARHLGLKKNNLPTPQTQRLRIKEIYDNNDKKFNNIEEEGITSRVEKI